VGGEFVKPYLIRRHVSVPASFASIVVNKTIQVVTGLIYAVVGVGFALFFFDLSAVVRAVMVGAVAIGGAVILWLVLQQQRNPFSALLGGLVRAGIRAGSTEDRRRSAAETDAHMATYYRQERVRLSAAVVVHCISWTFGVTETWLITHLLDQPVSFATAFFLTSLSTVITTAFFFVPAGIGVSEGSQAFLFALLGLPPAVGLTVGLVKRIRKIFYVLVGLLLISGWIIGQSKGGLEMGALKMR
jgi:uncharacterized membrane protein YbhN (UPF0104 family)